MRLNEQKHREEYIKMCIHRHRQSRHLLEQTAKDQQLFPAVDLLLFSHGHQIQRSAVHVLGLKNVFKKAIMIGCGWYCSMIFNTLSV